MHPGENFAAVGLSYGSWVMHGEGAGMPAVRKCIQHLTALLAAMIQLQNMDRKFDDAWPEPNVSKSEYRAAYIRLARLPLQYYSDVDDPFVVPSSVAVVGDLADDLTDIYRDVTGGLRLFKAGHKDAAIWHWVEDYDIHWSYHLFSAAKILNMYRRS